MAARRSAFVALMIHTSTGSVRVPPRRRTVRSSMTLSSLAWSGSLRSPTSSRKMVPVWAAWKSPDLACWAPVNAPRSKPKSSDSMSVSGIAAQLTATNGRAARGPWRCRRLATSPLPAPVSPDRSTAGNRPVLAAPRRSRRMLARTASMAGLAPSNASGALMRPVSYPGLRVVHPPGSGSEDDAGARRRSHELARHGHLHGDDRVEAGAVHGNNVVGIDRLELDHRLGNDLVGSRSKVKAAEDRVNLLDARHLLRLAHGVDDARVAARRDDDEPPVLYQEH